VRGGVTGAVSILYAKINSREVKKIEHRPIVEKGNRAILARPAEKLKEIL
jgi:hypothetical protein